MSALAGCTTTPSPMASPPRSVSCQPYGYTPAPIVFQVAPGPVSASTAEQTAVALFRACVLPTSIVTDLTSTTTEAPASQGGPDAGQTVWRVQVDATVTEPSPGARYRSHFWIEVNQATGVPTVIAYG